MNDFLSIEKNLTYQNRALVCGYIFHSAMHPDKFRKRNFQQFEQDTMQQQQQNGKAGFEINSCAILTITTNKYSSKIKSRRLKALADEMLYNVP